MTTKVLIDTDPGVDDALALFSALGLPHVQICEVTTCCGNANIETVSRNARYLLDSVGAEAIPVSWGAQKPRAQEAISSVVHGDDALGGLVLPEAWKARHSLQPSESEALSALTRFLVERGSEPRTIVALGPLTNIAQLLITNPEALRATDRLVILGGTYTAPGNKGPVAEFNFRCDPEAADIVLERCPCEVQLVPLDVCLQNVLATKELSMVRESTFRDFLEKLCGFYAEANESEEGINGIIMYDPLAVFCAAHPEFFTFERVWMRVDTGNSFARGMSVVDRRLRSDLPKNVSIATDVNWASFVSAFFEAINRLSFRYP